LSKNTEPHTTPVRIETQPNGDACIILGVTMPDGTVVTLRQPLDDNRVATLLQQLAGVVNVRTQERARTYSRPLKGYTPPKAPVALVPRVENVPPTVDAAKFVEGLEARPIFGRGYADGC